MGAMTIDGRLGAEAVVFLLGQPLMCLALEQVSPSFATRQTRPVARVSDSDEVQPIVFTLPHSRVATLAGQPEPRLAPIKAEMK